MLAALLFCLLKWSMRQPTEVPWLFFSKRSCAGSRASQDGRCIGRLSFGKAHILCSTQRARHLKPPFRCCCMRESHAAAVKGVVGRQSLGRREKDRGIFCLSVPSSKSTLRLCWWMLLSKPCASRVSLSLHLHLATAGFGAVG